MSVFITALEAGHDVKSFDCGNDALNIWLQQIARQHQKNAISQTFVLADEKAPEGILGFYSLALRALIPKQSLPAAMAKKLPAHVPAITLARLAVQKNQQSKGYGEELLVDAMRRARSASKTVGGWALFVDAKDEHAAAFYQRYGFVALPSDMLVLLIPFAGMPD